MNKLTTTAALLLGGAMMLSHAAYGQAVGNDLYFGFQNQAGGGANDYIINLGQASGIVGGSSPVNLSSDFSLADFESVLGTSSSMFGGVIGATNNSPADVFLTQLRSGGAGTPSTAGSDVTATMTRTEDDTTYSHLGSLYSPTAGSGGLDPSKSWEAYIDPANGTGTFQSNTGINPDSAVGLSGVLYEDLWETASSSFTGGKPYTYQGYFTLDAANSSLTFTPSATPVPEPGAYGIFGAAAALLLAFRRWIGLAKA